MSKKHTAKKVILILLIISALGFIWINSLMSGEVSGGLSGKVYEIFKSVFGENTFVTETLIRKAAHFSEFAFLGVLISLFMFENLYAKFSLAELFGLGIGLIDETLQLYTPGRSSSVKDSNLVLS